MYYNFFYICISEVHKQIINVLTIKLNMFETVRGKLQ